MKDSSEFVISRENQYSYATKSMPVEWVPHGFVIEIEGSIEATLLTKLQKICLSYYSVRQKKI